MNAYDLVCQAVQNEVGGGFHAEAIKAQAVASYTFIRYNNATVSRRR
jgi:stage II sporulation protein D